MSDDEGTVLVVDDDEDILALYERYLADFDVRTVTGGEKALDAVEDDVDVVVLDRRLPDRHGDEVLDRITESDLQVRVAMVTAVEPDFDIIEMPFDEYLTKPVHRKRLNETIDYLQSRMEYSGLVERYFRAVSKIAALEAAKSPEELAENDDFSALQKRAKRLQEQVADSLSEIDDYAGAFHEVNRISRRSSNE